MNSKSISKLDLVSKTAFKAGPSMAWLGESFKLILLLVDTPEVLLESYSFPNGELYIQTPETVYRLYSENGDKGDLPLILEDKRKEYMKIIIPSIIMHKTEIQLGKNFYFRISGENAKDEECKTGIVTGILLVSAYSSRDGDVSKLPEAELYKEFHS